VTQALTETIMKIESDCSFWVLDAIASLDLHEKVTDFVPDPMLIHQDDVKKMTHFMTEGRVGSCLGLLAQHHAQTRKRQDVLRKILVPAIYALEAAWKQRSIELGRLILAFGTARHVLDVWRSSSSRMMPQISGHGNSVLVTVAPQDQHTFGARLLADDLSMRGFDVTLLTEATSNELVTTVAQRKFVAIALSFGYDGALVGASDLVASLRLMSKEPNLAILAGGAGLSAPIRQYSFLGVDAVLSAAHEAASFVEGLLATKAARIRN
jgi:methylmalonyl-CoA mutase cobalamin-binding subunit